MRKKASLSSKKSNYALRLQASLKTEAEALAKAEGTTLNQLINVAVAEKLSALRTARYFEARAARGNPEAALSVLARMGEPGTVARGDEVEVNEPIA